MACCGKKPKINKPLDNRGNYFDKYAYLTPAQLKKKRELEKSLQDEQNKKEE